MKLKVTMTIDVDDDGWALEYGQMSTRELARDVTDYVTGLVEGSYNVTAENLTIASVTHRVVW